MQLLAFDSPGLGREKNLNRLINTNLAGLGCPVILDAAFLINYNYMVTSLEGGPLMCKGYEAFQSTVRTLKGSPLYVKDDFYCNRNPNLTSLEGGPIYVGGNFYCSGIGPGNNNTSLEGLPLYIGGKFYHTVRRTTTIDQELKHLVRDELRRVGTVLVGDIITGWED